MDKHKRLRLCLASVSEHAFGLCRLVALSLRRVAMGSRLRLVVGKRRAVGMANISSWPLDLVQRRMALGSVWIHSSRHELVVSGGGHIVAVQPKDIPLPAAIT